MTGKRLGFGAGLWLAVMLACLPPAAAAAREAPFDDSEIARAEAPDWFKKSFLDLREDLAEARAAGKRGLMVLFGTEGCAYCKAFIERTLADPAIASTVRANFDTLQLDIFDDSGMNDLQGQAMPVKDFARREGAAFSPTLVFYGLDGRRIFRAVGYQPPDRFRRVLDYVVGGHHRAMSFPDYLRRGASTAPADRHRQALVHDALFERAPSSLDRRQPARKPLLVLFERGGCAPCRELHGYVLRDPEVRALLPLFQAVQFDAGDATSPLLTPDGRSNTATKWAKELGLAELPAMVFFDEAGREVLRIDAVVYRQRMARALQYVLDKAYLRGIHFQRYTREKTLQRLGQGE
jgi:thioredoxin-related protein